MGTALEKAGTSGDALDLYIFGNVLRAGHGHSLPLQAAFKIGMPDTINGYAVDTTSHRPLVIIGARGTLGKAFARLCEVRGIPYHLLTRQEMDIAHPVTVDMVLTELQPWAVINAVGYVRVDNAEREQETICV
jgi:hypothetical protein